MPEPWNVRRVAPDRWIVELTKDTQEIAIVVQSYDTRLGRTAMWCWRCPSAECSDVAAVRSHLRDAHITDCD